MNEPDAENVLEQTAVSNEHAPYGPVSSTPEGDITLYPSPEHNSLVRQRGQPFYNTYPSLIPAYQSTFQHAADEIEITVPADSRYPDYGTAGFTHTLPEETVWDSASQYYFKEIADDHARLEVYRIILRGAKHDGSSYTWEELLCYKKDLEDPYAAFADGDLTLPPFFKLGEAEVPRHLWSGDMKGFSTATCPVTLDAAKLYQSLHHIKVRHLDKMRRNSTGGTFEGVAEGDAASLTTGELLEEDISVEGLGFFGCIADPVTAFSIERGTGYPVAPLTEAEFIADYGPYNAIKSPGYHNPVPACLTGSVAMCHATIAGYAAPILFVPIKADYPGRAPFSPAIDPFVYGDLATKRNFPIAGGASAFSDLEAWRAIATGDVYGFASAACELVPSGTTHDVYLDVVRFKVQKWKKTYYPWGYRYNYVRWYPWDPEPDPTFFWQEHDGYVDYPQNRETPVDDELISEEWHDIVCPHLVWAPFED